MVEGALVASGGLGAGLNQLARYKTAPQQGEVSPDVTSDPAENWVGGPAEKSVWLGGW